MYDNGFKCLFLCRTSQTAVIVTVTDIANNQPSFPANTYSIVVSEGALSGSSVFQGNALSDSDPNGDSLIYTMVPIGINQNQLFPDFTISPE